MVEAELGCGADVVPGARRVLEQLQAEVRSRFDAGVPARELVPARARTVDRILRTAWERLVANALPGASLVAVGGYGRGELHPHSDIDLLVLLPGGDGLTDGDRETLERFVTLLWDIRLDVGHAVRTVAQCVEEALADVTVATTLMESRLLAGDAARYEAMREATGADRIWPSPAFFEAKLAEQNERHARHHGTGYNLEPNVKEGPGGLRDIQMVGRVVKRHFGAERLEELVTHGFLTGGELDELVEGQSFLWQVRMALHLAAGRKEDRLLFDHQRELAVRFGYEDAAHNLGVEQFMRHYYRTIMELSRLNEMLLQLFEELFLGHAGPPLIEPLNRRFQVRNGYLETTADDVFRRYPFALLEMFLLLQQNPQIQGVHASTIRLVRDHRHLIDGAFREDRACRSLFLEIIRQPRGQTHEFRRMHSYGVLAAYLPVFGKIVGLMQFDLFHAYTVDEHALFTVRNLRQFMVPEHAHELPHCSAISARLPKPEILYLAGLFHDIAKGRGGDHSTLGADDALAFCRHHEMGEYDAKLVAWLVRNHLVMSVTAQRKDISDPEVVREFAATLGDQVRLDYLYLLTVADIRATNPNLWNDWRDSLLRELYVATRRCLRRGLDSPVAAADMARECRDEARMRLVGEGVDAAAIEQVWSEHDEDYFVRSRPEDVVWHTREVLTAGPRDYPIVAVRTVSRGTEIFIYGPDLDYLFAATTSILERLGLNVLDARLFTDRRGMTYDSYTVLELDGSRSDDPDRHEEIRHALNGGLREPTKAASTPVRRPSRLQRSFDIAPRIHIEDDPYRGASVVELVAGDAPGLLCRVGWAIAKCGCSLVGAKVATLGERAEDVFLVKSESGLPLSESEQETLEAAIVEAIDETSTIEAVSPR